MKLTDIPIDKTPAPVFKKGDTIRVVDCPKEVKTIRQLVGLDEINP